MYLEAINIRPKEEKAYLELADIYTEQGKYEEAVKILEKGKKQNKGKKIKTRLKSAEARVQEKQYEPILSQYRALMADNYCRDKREMEDFESYLPGKNINFELALAAADEEEYQVYYALKDIDNNGVPELFIGLGMSAEEARQYDIFSLSGETPVSLFPNESFGYRTNFDVYTDGTIEVVGVGSAIDHVYDSYRISDDGYTPDLIESLSVFGDWSEQGEEPLIKYYHDAEGKKEISEEEFNKIKDQYESKEKETFEWILLEEKQESHNQTADQYEAYYELCMEYQDKYGEGRIEEEDGFDDYFKISVLKGLYAVQLIDFNGDNKQELLLGYYEDPVGGEGSGYAYEIWAWNNGTLKNVLEKQPANNIEGMAWLETTSEGEEVYIVKDHRMDATTGSAEYLTYDGESFYTKYDIVVPIPEFGEPGSINGETEADSKVIRFHNKLSRPYYPKADGDLNVRYQNENGRRLYIPLSTDWHQETTKEELEDYNQALQTTKKNINTLKTK